MMIINTSLQNEEKEKKENVTKDIVTRLQEDEHLKEVSVKREEKVEPVKQEVLEQELIQQEVQEQEPSQQEVLEESEEEVVTKDDGPGEAEDKTIIEENVSGGEGYVLCTKAGENEIKEEKKVKP